MSETTTNTSPPPISSARVAEIIDLRTKNTPEKTKEEQQLERIAKFRALSGLRKALRESTLNPEEFNNLENEPLEPTLPTSTTPENLTSSRTEAIAVAAQPETKDISRTKRVSRKDKPASEKGKSARLKEIVAIGSLALISLGLGGLLGSYKGPNPSGSAAKNKPPTAASPNYAHNTHAKSHVKQAIQTSPTINYNAETPWDAYVEAYGSAEAAITHLNQDIAANKNITIHNLGTTNEWLSVGSHSDSASVLRALQKTHN